MNITMNIASECIETFCSTVKAEHRIIRSNWIFVPDNFWLGVYKREIPDNCISVLCMDQPLSVFGAPLTYIEKVEKLYIASSFTDEIKLPWGSHPDLDNNVRWTNTRVEHDGL